MRKLSLAARLFFAIAIIAFGIQHPVYGAFVTRVVPTLPVPPVLAYLVGCGLVVAGAALLSRKRAPAAGLILGAGLLLSFLLLYVPMLFRTEPLSGLWTNAGKALALAGGAFLVAGSVAPERSLPLQPLVSISPLFLSAFLILCGIQHFLFVTFVATLVPAWIPGHVFWTYFAGIALIAGGIGILIPKLTRIAALLTGFMIFLWIVTLHIPRALADLHNSNETTAVFEAIAMSAMAFLIAARAERSTVPLARRAGAI